MKEIKTWTLGWTLADAFRTWLEENGFDFDTYDAGGLYTSFDVEVNEEEEEEIDNLMYTDGLYEYMGVDPNEQLECEPY